MFMLCKEYEGLKDTVEKLTNDNRFILSEMTRLENRIAMLERKGDKPKNSDYSSFPIIPSWVLPAMSIASSALLLLAILLILLRLT